MKTNSYQINRSQKCMSKFPQTTRKSLSVPTKKVQGGLFGAALTLCLIPQSDAAVLTGAGPNLNIAGLPHGFAPGVPHSTTVLTGAWNGTWTTPAHSDWHGTFNANGQQTNSAAGMGTTTYDFSGLSTATLPQGTYFLFGDVDSGSAQNEFFDLQAFDSSGNLLSLWLDEATHTWGTSPTATTAPGWSWNNTTKTYRIHGNNVAGNPSFGVSLISNQDIADLEVFKNTTHYGMSLRAPVPEPSVGILTVLSASFLLLRRKRS